MQIPNQESSNLPLPDRTEAVKRGWKNIASTVAILAIAPILAIFITIFVFQSYEVYGMSMDTSLQDGDRLIVQKLSKNWARLFGNDYLPQRGEIIVFDKPKFISNTSDNVQHLIKRVIGLPGDRVVVKSGKVTVYNQEHPDGYDPDEGQYYAKDIITSPGNVDVTVSENEVFDMGDNRTNSLDSRSFGAISADSITGIAKLRFVPVGSFKKF